MRRVAQRVDGEEDEHDGGRRDAEQDDGMEAVFSDVGVFRSPHRSLIHVERIRLVT